MNWRNKCHPFMTPQRKRGGVPHTRTCLTEVKLPLHASQRKRVSSPRNILYAIMIQTDCKPSWFCLSRVSLLVLRSIARRRITGTRTQVQASCRRQQWQQIAHRWRLRPPLLALLSPMMRRRLRATEHRPRWQGQRMVCRRRSPSKSGKQRPTTRDKVKQRR